MTTYTAHCKYCDKKFEVKSKWLPSSCLDLAMETKGFFHAIAKHRKELTARAFFKAIGRITKYFLISLVGIIIIPIGLLFYPLYLLLALFYE